MTYEEIGRAIVELMAEQRCLKEDLVYCPDMLKRVRIQERIEDVKDEIKQLKARMV